MTQHRSRAQQKERTRRAILDTTLRLTGEMPLAALSLRQVAKKVGIVPAAFYRHFDSMDAVGMALVEESFASLRAVLRDVRRGRPSSDELIRTSVDVLVEHAQEQRGHFQFIARERFAGPKRVRGAVHHQLELFEHELAIDLARRSPATWSSEDLRLVSKLIVGAMVATMADFVEGDPDAAAEVAEQAEKQLRMLAVGALHWRSDQELE